MHYRFNLTNFDSYQKNGLQNCITVSNIQIASVVSNVFIHTYDKIMYQ